MAKTAYIGIGSNLGDKQDNCLRAIEQIERIPGCQIEARSGFYRTEPVGVEGQDWFVNGVFSLSADISARHLLKSLLAVEADMGRKRKKKWDSRIIDLDILLYGKDVTDKKDLIIPHPHVHLRRFVLAPMVQLAPDLIHPVSGKTMARLLRDLPVEGQGIVPLEE